jgi:hypothetical protein
MRRVYFDLCVDRACFYALITFKLIHMGHTVNPGGLWEFLLDKRGCFWGYLCTVLCVEETGFQARRYQQIDVFIGYLTATSSLGTGGGEERNINPSLHCSTRLAGYEMRAVVMSLGKFILKLR